MDKLIRDLEAATEGSRILDQKVFAHVECGGDFHSCHFAAVVQAKTYPHYTTSLDDALTMVEEGMAWTIISGAIYAACVGDVSTGNPVTSAATPELAFCIACLKARNQATPRAADTTE